MLPGRICGEGNVVTYHEMLGWSQAASMLIFGAIMAGVLVYALWPSNKKSFDAAANLPLLIDENDDIRNGSFIVVVGEEGMPHGRS
jgi:cytochrome c oxidase cbb3-type subunit 4